MSRESQTDGARDVLTLMDPRNLIDSCEEWVRWSFRALVFNLALAGFGKGRVITGRRTFGDQVALYGQGRSKDEMAVIGLSGVYSDPKARRVTWLQPHMSRHVSGAAVDVDFSDYAVELLGPIEDICRQLGITWGGVWSVRDYSHFER